MWAAQHCQSCFHQARTGCAFFAVYVKEVQEKLHITPTIVYLIILHITTIMSTLPVNEITSLSPMSYNFSNSHHTSELFELDF